MTYHFSKTVNMRFDDAVASTKEALKRHNFQVLTEIDMKDNFKKGLNVDFRPYLILGVRNPQLTYRALQAEDKIGTRYFLELLGREGVQVFEPAVALLRSARGRGMRTAVASSSRHCAEILRAGHLTAFFDVRVDGIDLDDLGLPGKPAPDMFLEAARRLGAFPACAVVFEDATTGVAAGFAPAVSALSSA